MEHGNLMHHVKIVRESSRRETIQSGLAVAMRKLAQREDTSAVVDELNTLVNSLESVSASELRNIGNTMDGLVDELDRRFQANGEIVGLTTGLKDLDESIQGMQDGNLIIIAGRPAMGKSVLAQNIASHNALKGENVLFFSLEMTEFEIQQRLVSSVGCIDYGSIQSASCVGDDSQITILGDTINKIKKGKFHIDDSSSLSVHELKSKAISFQRKTGSVGLVVVDYLQLLSAKAESRFQEVSTISRELKALAKVLECPVIALSQLSRSLESRADKRPLMSDLRESGQLEQDADKILFIYRDEVYNESTPAKGLAEIILGKARNCPKKDVVSIFDGAKQTFRNADHTAYERIDSVKNPPKENGNERSFTAIYK
jgi:replicative DNA helicase